MRGGVYYLEHPEWGRRPVLVLTREAAIPVLKRVTIASITRTIRGIPTEVVLDEHDGMPGPVRGQLRLGTGANDRLSRLANLRHAAGLNRRTGPDRSLVSRTVTRWSWSATSTQLPPLPEL
jgi:mRNA interferase MazF